MRRRPFETGSELEDRKEVGEVVAQHVAGDADRVLPGAARRGEARRARDTRISI